MPRQCGIATFTADLAQALSNADPELSVDSVAMNDQINYVYSERVCYEIDDSDEAAYRPAADFINRYGYDILSVQHEYGIFGGAAGAYLMGLVREAKMPIVTTLHTVLRDPSFEQKKVMDELLQLSERVVVMSQKAVEFLIEVHDVPPVKIDFIPHGIPHIESEMGIEMRSKLSISGPMILTFGLLSPDKGIQYVIEAMPSIIKEHPGATYFIVGATHPHIRASVGETYRESLVKLTHDLGVSDNVRFVDRFVAIEELVEYLAATDIYVTPYLNPKQITSGTLAYAVGAGKAVISTPYWYAEELLAEGRGLLVPFRDATAIADCVLKLQSSPDRREAMGLRAAEYGEQMYWPEVAKSYIECFTRAKLDSAERLRQLVQKQTVSKSFEVLPELQLNHLIELSDDTGILQHATFTIPNRSEGYCVDDNARALLFTTYANDPELNLLQGRYLSFVLDAFNLSNGRFRNFMSYQREWLEEAGSEDSHARSLWALGAVVNRCKNRNHQEVAKSTFELAAPALYKTTSMRTWAYGILAIGEYLQAFPVEHSISTLLQTLAIRLSDHFEFNHANDWRWFEQNLAYANSRIPQALMIGGETLGRQQMIDTGAEALRWLMKIQTGPNEVFAPIGTNGFYTRGEERSYFDQQPIEAWASVSACLCAWRLTGNQRWQDEANRAFHWFLGQNMLGQSLYDPTSGGCRDGLHPNRVNKNQGAESTLSYLCARAEMHAANVLPTAVATNIKSL